MVCSCPSPNPDLCGLCLCLSPNPLCLSPNPDLCGLFLPVSESRLRQQEGLWSITSGALVVFAGAVNARPVGQGSPRQQLACARALYMSASCRQAHRRGSCMGPGARRSRAGSRAGLQAASSCTVPSRPCQGASDAGRQRGREALAQGGAGNNASNRGYWMFVGWVGVGGWWVRRGRGWGPQDRGGWACRVVLRGTRTRSAVELLQFSWRCPPPTAAIPGLPLYTCVYTHQPFQAS